MSIAWTQDGVFLAKPSKYRAVKTVVGDITFDSKREAARFCELKLLLRAGQIHNLELQPEFHFKLDGTKIFTYRADFTYFEDGERVVEDCKGFATPVYRLKKKLIEHQHNITIRET
jgi:hypothetical protein